MWTLFKVFIEFVTTLLGLCSSFGAKRHLGSWLPNQGLNSQPLH